MNDIISKAELDRMVQHKEYSLKDFPMTIALTFHLLLVLLPIILGFGFGTGLINKWYAWTVIALNGWLQGVIMSFKWTKVLMKQKGWQ